MGNGDNLELLLKLTKIKSDTDTKEEKDVESYIWKYFNEIKYFNEHKTFGLSYLFSPLFQFLLYGTGIQKNETLV